jgi:hypothetical protein
LLADQTPLTILYTASLAGRIDLLPRLYTRIRRERETRSGPCLLVDLGQSCVPGTWICEATAGRGMLVAMDAMGYDAFHIGPRDALYTQPALVSQVRQIVVTPFAAGPWSASVNRAGLAVRLVNAHHLEALLAAEDVGPADLIIGLRLDVTAQVEAEHRAGQRVLLLQGAASEDEPVLARVDVALLPEAPYILVVSHAPLALAPELPPDPTITGVIEFVQGEARYAERKRGQS